MHTIIMSDALVGDVGRGERRAHGVLEPQALPHSRDERLGVVCSGSLREDRSRRLRDKNRAEEVYLQHDG